MSFVNGYILVITKIMVQDKKFIENTSNGLNNYYNSNGE